MPLNFRAELNPLQSVAVTGVTGAVGGYTPPDESATKAKLTEAGQVLGALDAWLGKHIAKEKEVEFAKGTMDAAAMATKDAATEALAIQTGREASDYPDVYQAAATSLAAQNVRQRTMTELQSARKAAFESGTPMSPADWNNKAQEITTKNLRAFMDLPAASQHAANVTTQLSAVGAHENTQYGVQFLAYQKDLAYKGALTAAGLAQRTIQQDPTKTVQAVGEFFTTMLATPSTLLDTKQRVEVTRALFASTLHSSQGDPNAVLTIAQTMDALVAREDTPIELRDELIKLSEKYGGEIMTANRSALTGAFDALLSGEGVSSLAAIRGVWPATVQSSAQLRAWAATPEFAQRFGYDSRNKVEAFALRYEKQALEYNEDLQKVQLVSKDATGVVQFSAQNAATLINAGRNDLVGTGVRAFATESGIPELVAWASVLEKLPNSMRAQVAPQYQAAYRQLLSGVVTADPVQGGALAAQLLEYQNLNVDINNFAKTDPVGKVLSQAYGNILASSEYAKAQTPEQRREVTQRMLGDTLRERREREVQLAALKGSPTAKEALRSAQDLSPVLSSDAGAVELQAAAYELLTTGAAVTDLAVSALAMKRSAGNGVFVPEELTRGTQQQPTDAHKAVTGALLRSKLPGISEDAIVRAIESKELLATFRGGVPQMYTVQTDYHSTPGMVQLYLRPKDNLNGLVESVSMPDSTAHSVVKSLDNRRGATKSIAGVPVQDPRMEYLPNLGFSPDGTAWLRAPAGAAEQQKFFDTHRAALQPGINSELAKRGIKQTNHDAYEVLSNKLAAIGMVFQGNEETPAAKVRGQKAIRLMLDMSETAIRPGVSVEARMKQRKALLNLLPPEVLKSQQGVALSSWVSGHGLNSLSRTLSELATLDPTPGLNFRLGATPTPRPLPTR